MTHLITSKTDWTKSLIQEVYGEIEKIALEEMELDPYPNQIEIIGAEKMIDAYASVGMPIHYNHWSFGKEFLQNFQSYQSGKSGLAYEIVINTNPCISYLMEENDMTMQTLVIAHAAFGHNHFFRHNFLYKEWTEAGSIIDFMIFAKEYIRDCEERYGDKEVERVLDAAHALASHGVDKYKRKTKTRKTERQQENEETQSHIDTEHQEMDIVFQRVIKKKKKVKKTLLEIEPEENLLYFLEKNIPGAQWKKEVIRIVRKIHQYWYPQGQTKIANEGFASFTHHYIMNRLEEKGIISPDAMLSFITSHTGVVYQPTYRKKWYNGVNPYALGFAMFSDIKRMCENPTAEDLEWFPELKGVRWQDAVKHAVANYRDDSFLQQYLSPKVIRDFGLFSVKFTRNATPIVTEIHDEIGYREVRNALAEANSRINFVPEIMVKSVNSKNDRKLTLEYFPYLNRDLDIDYAKKTLVHLKALWEYPVEIIQTIGGTPAVLVNL